MVHYLIDDMVIFVGNIGSDECSRVKVYIVQILDNIPPKLVGLWFYAHIQEILEIIHYLDGCIQLGCLEGLGDERYLPIHVKVRVRLGTNPQ